jgi:hypothetical protein
MRVLCAGSRITVGRLTEVSPPRDDWRRPTKRPCRPTAGSRDSKVPRAVKQCGYLAPLTGSVALRGGDTPTERFVMQLAEPKGWRPGSGLGTPPVTGSRRLQDG